mgnify:CR=1|jgi:hypothetical protein
MNYHIDNIPFNFGKHVDKTAYQIAEIDPEYIIQLYYIIPKLPITKELYRECLAKYYY